MKLFQSLDKINVSPAIEKLFEEEFLVEYYNKPLQIGEKYFHKFSAYHKHHTMMFNKMNMISHSRNMIRRSFHELNLQ